MNWTKGPLTIKRDAGNGQYRVHTSKSRYSIAHFDMEFDATLFAHAAELAEAAEPRLNDKTRELLNETAEAEQFVGDPKVADAIRFLLEKEDRLAVALKRCKGE